MLLGDKNTNKIICLCFPPRLHLAFDNIWSAMLFLKYLLVIIDTVLLKIKIAYFYKQISRIYEIQDTFYILL